MPAPFWDSMLGGREAKHSFRPDGYTLGDHGGGNHFPYGPPAPGSWPTRTVNLTSFGAQRILISKIYG
jgi:hypothetical protein